ncbi:MAG: MBL fold metallo-hydrolase [Clostridiales bacterium]|nr:MBL fold metallo-hydrolase [Clostridiales bacterium]
MSAETNGKTHDPMTAQRKRKLFAALSVAIVVLLLALFVVGYYCGWFDGLVYRYNRTTYNVNAILSEQLSIHFLQMPNGVNGDCIYIKAGETDVLIDAGSRQNSARYISSYVNRFCTDGKLEFVIATHADYDHVSGFTSTNLVKGIFDRYECETIIQFARTNKDANKNETYLDYCVARDREIANGANCYTALECYNNVNGAKRSYELAEGITMTVLYQEYYETYSDKENNYSVCLLISQEYEQDGKTERNNYLLMGDLEEAGEQSLVKCNPDLPEVTLYKGSHHGSKTSSNDVLLRQIKPQIVCVNCVAGSVEHTQNLLNTFPTQDFINRIAPYTDEVYVTNVAQVKLNSTGSYVNTGYSPLNGDVVIACTDGVITKYFSNSDVRLKDTEWFKQNRNCPESWS